MSTHQWRFQDKFRELGQQIAIATVDIFDRGLSMSQLVGWLLLPWKSLDRSALGAIFIGGAYL